MRTSAVAALVLACGSAFGQCQSSFTANRLDPVNFDYATNGSALYDDNGDRPFVFLTNGGGQQGSMFFYEQFVVGLGFWAQFRVRLDPGAFFTGDGMAFVIHSSGPMALGSGGSGIGYEGIPYSVAIEFDTFSFTGEYPVAHLSVQTRGNAGNAPDDGSSLGWADLGPSFADGKHHDVIVRYDDDAENLSIWVDRRVTEPPTLSVPLNLKNINGDDILQGGECAWLGFTAGTGLADSVHAVTDLHFIADDAACVGASFTDLIWNTQPVREGRRVEFEFDGTASPPIRFFWRLNSVEISDDGVITGSSTRRLVIDPVGFEHEGILDYAFENECSGTGSGFLLDVLCKADVNEDGAVDLADFFEFFGCYDLEHPCGDVNFDGSVDLADFFDFFGSYDTCQ